MNIKACLSKVTDNWRTPSVIYNEFMKKGYVDTFKFKSNEDELNNIYIDKKLFINPPFSKMNKIVFWILDQLETNKKVCLLIPSRTDTQYFHLLMTQKSTVIFIKGRLHYNDSNCAPFPTLLIIFDKKNKYVCMTQEELLKFINVEL